MPTNFDNYPYGAYLARDAYVYFDRKYRPIVRVTAFPATGNPAVTACDPAERIEYSGQAWFYSDGNPPRRNSETRARLKNLLATIPQLAAEVRRRGSRRRTEDGVTLHKRCCKCRKNNVPDNA